MAAVTRTPPPSSSRLATMIASSPSVARTSRIASAMVAAWKDFSRTGAILSQAGRHCPAPRAARAGYCRSRVASWPSDLPQGPDLRFGMDLVLRHHDRRRAEPYDDRAHIRADARAGQQHGRLA